MKQDAVRRKKAVVLLSGGLDSAVTMAVAHSEGFETHALSFRYGQRHSFEIEAAGRVAESLGAVEHGIVDLPELGRLGGSALTDLSIPVPKLDSARGEPAAGIPLTYVPARNTIFLAIALARAETLGTGDIFIGVNAIDYSGYPDCRPEFIKAFEKTANLALKAAVEGRLAIEIHTPLINKSKAEIIRQGATLGVDFSLTHSCYDPAEDGAACGCCDSCRIRRAGFAAACIPDPTRYSGG